MMMTGANLGFSLTVNLEQYEDLAGHDVEAGVVVCATISSFLADCTNTQYDQLFASYCRTSQYVCLSVCLSVRPYVRDAVHCGVQG